MRAGRSSLPFVSCQLVGSILGRGGGFGGKVFGGMAFGINEALLPRTQLWFSKQTTALVGAQASIIASSMLVALIVSGCSFSGTPESARVEGCVKAEFSGLSDCVIIFLPVSGGRKAWSDLAEDGQYELAYQRSSTGHILPGDYDVLVLKKTMEDLPIDTDRTGVRVHPSSVRVVPGINSLNFVVEKIPGPHRFSFKCQYEPEQLLEGLSKRIPAVNWALEEGRQPAVSGNFLVDGKSAHKCGVCLKWISPGVYELEDWASTLDNRGKWPETLDSQKLMKVIKAKEIKKQSQGSN